MPLLKHVKITFFVHILWVALSYNAIYMYIYVCVENDTLWNNRILYMPQSIKTRSIICPKGACGHSKWIQLACPRKIPGLTSPSYNSAASKDFNPASSATSSVPRFLSRTQLAQKKTWSLPKMLQFQALWVSNIKKMIEYGRICMDNSWTVLQWKLHANACNFAKCCQNIHGGYLTVQSMYPSAELRVLRSKWSDRKIRHLSMDIPGVIPCVSQHVEFSMRATHLSGNSVQGWLCRCDTASHQQGRGLAALPRIGPTRCASKTD